MQGVYAIIDVETLLARRIDPLRFARAVCEARPAAIQIRDKRHAAREMLALLREVAAAADDVPLFANDRPDLAALSGCDGCHLGQDDLPVAEARAVMRAIAGREMMVGMSVHDDHELARALAQKPDYLAFGAVFGTQSKKSGTAPTLGLEELGRLVAAAREATDVPLVAIGGIDREGAARLTMVDAVVVLSALIVDDPDPYRAARAETEAIAQAFRGRAR